MAASCSRSRRHCSGPTLSTLVEVRNNLSLGRRETAPLRFAAKTIKSNVEVIVEGMSACPHDGGWFVEFYIGTAREIGINCTSIDMFGKE